MLRQVYLVQCDSTTTTVARGKPFWVTEQRLRRLKPSEQPVRRSVAPAPWQRRWSKNISFEQARAKAMRELERQLELERKIQASGYGQAPRPLSPPPSTPPPFPPLTVPSW